MSDSESEGESRDSSSRSKTDETKPKSSEKQTNSKSNESVNIRLPTFWSNSVAAWFFQVEAQFTIGQVKSDLKKYNYVVASLPQDVAESLMDIFESPPETDLYKNLKDTLIKRHSLSIEKRIKQLVSDEEIGDRRPSEFYRRMKILAGATATVGDDFLKKLWLNRLPNLISIALIPQSEGELETLLSTADKIWEAMSSSNSVSALHNAPSSTANGSNRIEDGRFSRLEKEMQSLRHMISSLNFNQRNSRSRSRENNENRSQIRNSRSNSRRRQFDRRGSLCWYHFKYGDQAQKCVQPCRRNLTPASSSAATNSQSPN